MKLTQHLNTHPLLAHINIQIVNPWLCSNPQDTHGRRQIVKYWTGYFHVCPEANLTILQHIWNAPRHPLSSSDQARGPLVRGEGNTFVYTRISSGSRSPQQSPGHPAWGCSVSTSIACEYQPRCENCQERDRESRYDDGSGLWSVSAPAPGPRVVTQSWHCHAVTRPVWCAEVSVRPPQTLMTHRPRTGRHSHTGSQSWPAGGMSVADHNGWCLTYGSPGTPELGIVSTQPQSIQGIYWDLGKQRISKLYRFFISNNPSPRIRPFKSQSNLTSDHRAGSSPASQHPASQLSDALLLLMSSWAIRHPDTPPAVRASDWLSGGHCPAFWPCCDPVIRGDGARWALTQISGHISNISTLGAHSDGLWSVFTWVQIIWD